MGEEVPAPPIDASGGAGSATPVQRLLEVQDHDTVVDQLRHRRETLPERALLREIEVRLSSLNERFKEAQTQRDDLGTRQATLEQQIEASKTRRSELERRMYGGQVTNPRDLQAMNEEIRHLGRHIGELEDREIEVMEVLEPIDGELGSLDGERESLDNDATGLRNAISRSEFELDQEMTSERTERDRVATAVPPELLVRYEQLRKKLGGTGAARLVNGTCMGCHLALPAMEVDRIKRVPGDVIVTCEQCGRILVR